MFNDNHHVTVIAGDAQPTPIPAAQRKPETERNHNLLPKKKVSIMKVKNSMKKGSQSG